MNFFENFWIFLFYRPESSFFHFAMSDSASIGVILSGVEDKISDIIISSSLNNPGVETGDAGVGMSAASTGLSPAAV